MAPVRRSRDPLDLQSQCCDPRNCPRNALRKVLDLALGVSFVGIPVAITIAATRYRLYEIDRIVSRTVSYTLVIGFLGSAYLGVISLLTTVLDAGNDVAVAGSTLAVVALFNPIRRKVVVWIDRRFNRSRYSASVVTERFAGRMRANVDATQILDDWIAVVQDTMQPRTVGVWLSHADRNPTVGPNYGITIESHNQPRTW